MEFAPYFGLPANLLLAQSIDCTHQDALPHRDCNTRDTPSLIGTSICGACDAARSMPSPLADAADAKSARKKFVNKLTYGLLDYRHHALANLHKCVEVLLAVCSNVVKEPGDARFRKVSMGKSARQRAKLGVACCAGAHRERVHGTHPASQARAHCSSCSSCARSHTVKQCVQLPRPLHSACVLPRCAPATSA